MRTSSLGHTSSTAVLLCAAALLPGCQPSQVANDDAPQPKPAVSAPPVAPDTPKYQNPQSGPLPTYADVETLMADVDAICPDWQVEEPLDPTAEWSLRCDELGAGIQLSLGSLEYGRSVEEARQQFAAIVDHPDNPDYRCSAEGFFGAAIVMGGNWFAVADDSVAAQIALATGGYLEPAANCPG